MSQTSDNLLQELGLDMYSKEQYEKFHLAFRNTERDVFVITRLCSINDGPKVMYRVQLPEDNKVTFKSGLLARSKSFYSVKVDFQGCYHNCDGEIVINMNLQRLLNLSSNDSKQILEHPKFSQKSIQVPVHIRLEDDCIYLLLDSEYDFEILDADKDYTCFSRIKKPEWDVF
ncbi:hypothetical protein [Pseudoalteromonas denitrificans]|jgi:hypothetical protein|uniref:Uncharacterized protein n=1 Tax=Pseudoalteromonas denitrificans DSM 6059 TaxID=1123010 RepID=A0A1I1ELN7_9GAMM|nr:hypothetical protein [Pseudoalteromonas denitrificans]SFB87552.1 hypothetical protein SAMN02745724_00322 [Pseudoalteromonas denitrificans DSM 6059]